jgi:short/branched chain acyl-CoA dehydrogenase
MGERGRVRQCGHPFLSQRSSIRPTDQLTNDYSNSYVWNDRKQFGQLVGAFQGMQHQMAQAYTEISAARALVYNAARKKEAGEDFVRDAAMAKLYASQVAGRVSGSAIEWMGGMGFVREGIAEKMWRDSKIGAIYEGTSNIQLQTIAKLLQKEYTK